MEVYCVYLDDVYLKAFKNQTDAATLSDGLKIFLMLHDMDVDMVRISKEVL